MISPGWAFLLGVVGGVVGAVIGMVFVAFLMGQWMKGQEAQQAADRILREIRDNDRILRGIRDNGGS